MKISHILGTLVLLAALLLPAGIAQAAPLHPGVASPVRGFTMTPKSATYMVVPGTVFEGAVKLHNLGNEPLRVTLAMASRSGWATAVEQSQVVIPAYGTIVVKVWVKIPMLSVTSADMAYVKASDGGNVHESWFTFVMPMRHD